MTPCSKFKVTSPNLLVSESLALAHPKPESRRSQASDLVLLSLVPSAQRRGNTVQHPSWLSLSESSLVLWAPIQTLM